MYRTDMLNDTLAVLISRHLSKESSSEEEQELFALLITAPEQQYFLDLLSDYWFEKEPAIPRYGNADARFRRIIERARDYHLIPSSHPFASACLTSFEKVKSTI